MTFLWPWMLLLLLGVPLLVFGYLGIERRRATRLAGIGLGRSGPDDGSGHATLRADVRRYAPATILLTGIVMLIVALARPQAVVAIPREEGIVVLVFDVSGSMAATDGGGLAATTPAPGASGAPAAGTRIAAAKAIATAFVERQPSSVIIGVVAFSDSGLSVQVPTNDQSAVLAAIDRLQPQRGTSVAQGITAALTTIANTRAPRNEGYYTSRSPETTATPVPLPPGSDDAAVIVLLSDGENTVRPDPIDAAQAASDQGIRIQTVGLGSPAGTTLRVGEFQVHTQLDEAMLQQIASMTDGTYTRADVADAGAALTSVDDVLGTKLVARDEDIEVTAIMAGAGMLLLVVGGVAGMISLGRLP